MKYLNYFLLAFLFITTSNLKGQTVYQHISYDGIYDFLEEMATEGHIELNSATRPYSRDVIAGKLKKIKAHEQELNQRQSDDLHLYMKEYRLEFNNPYEGKYNLIKKGKKIKAHLLPPILTHIDSLTRIGARPVYGIRYISNKNENFYHSFGGAEAWAYIGDHWGIYASLRDNYQNKEILARPNYLTREMGGNYKIGVQGRSGGDYSEMRGGITYTWDWGHIGLIKDHLSWGDNNHGANIFSGRTPSYAMVKLHLQPVHWLEFDYFHGWLVSEVIDSTRSYYTSNGDFRAVFREKYIAANLYTFKPWKRLNFSVGNSIVYSDMDIQPAYFIPFFFFKSIDHTLNHGIENQNSQMFFNVSSRQIKHLHLYGTVFVDEFSVTRINDPGRHNFYSYKAGFGLSNWPVSNAGLQAEYTITSPLTYKHRVPATTFATNQFNLGHYLKDNVEEIYLGLWVKPAKGLRFDASYTYARHGRDYEYVFDQEYPIDEKPFLEDKSWDSSIIQLKANYKLHANFNAFAEYHISDYRGYDLEGIRAQTYLDLFTPGYLQEETNTLTIGFNYGF
ncbi:MAG: hypothetical protein K9I94_15420 [Bacteroidales bacterium]|nr:hypothetical protein [Bacteroidales bacterium]